MELSRRELNVLRRLLNRAEFKPQDVAQLGLERLTMADGLGSKGLGHVLDWLAGHGYCLRATADPPVVLPLVPDAHIHRRLEKAQDLLLLWGWQVYPPNHGHPAEPESRS